jgi:hypothetical protein
MSEVDFEILKKEIQQKEEHKPHLRLLPLLNFNNCSKSSEVVDQAELIAEELLSHWYVFSFGKVRKILEIEFYVSIPGVLEDETVHHRPELMSQARFYTHTNCQEGNWSPPIFNRHGIDITCGNRSREIRAGILLRHIDGENHRAGPALTLRAMVRGDQGFKKLHAGDPDWGWTPYEEEYLKELNNANIFKGKTRLVYIGGEQQMPQSSKRIGIENSSHANLPTRFFLG